MAPVGVLELEEESARAVPLGSGRAVTVGLGCPSSSVRLGKDSSLLLPSAATAPKGLIWESEE